jgi:hypothetical protein
MNPSTRSSLSRATLLSCTRTSRVSGARCRAPLPSEPDLRVVLASGSSKPRGAIQVREDAGSWLLVPVDWRWQSVCTRRGSSEVLSLRLADLRFGERRVVIA